MAGGRYTTGIFDAANLWFARLEAATWPTHSVTNRVPEVTFGDVDPQRGFERVGLVVDFERTQAEWANTSPAGRDEVFVLTAVAKIGTPRTTTAKDAWDRLEAFVVVIEDTLFDRAAPATRPLGFDGEVDLGLVTTVLPVVYPLEGGSWGGTAEVAARFRSKR